MVEGQAFGQRKVAGGMLGHPATKQPYHLREVSNRWEAGLGKSPTLQNKGDDTLLNCALWQLGLGRVTEFSSSTLSTLSLGECFRAAGTVRGFQGCGAESDGMVTRFCLGRC